MNWKLIKRIIAGLFALSVVGLVAAAATADSDQGVRSDGSRAPRKKDND